MTREGLPGRPWNWSVDWVRRQRREPEVTDYISTADTAKAIRLVLRETFPKGTRFAFPSFDLAPIYYIDRAEEVLAAG